MLHGRKASEKSYRSIGSAHKAAETLHFRAEVGLGEGLRQTVEWMKSNK